MKPLFMKFLSLGLTLILSVTMVIGSAYPAAPAAGGVSGAAFPDARDYGALKWSYKAGTGYANALTPPTVQGDYIYVGTGNRILKLDRETGALLGSVVLADTFGFATAALTYAADVEGRNVLFAPISEGRVQAVDADSMESLWITETLTGQSCLSRVVYDEGYIYFGTWRTETTAGKFLCYSAADENPAIGTEVKARTWEVSHTGGFYWAEAYAGGGRVVFGSEDGQNGFTSPTAKLFSCMSGGDFKAAGLGPSDSPVLDDLTVTGDVRSGVVYDPGLDTYFFTSRAGILYKATLAADGTFPETGGLASLSLGGVTTGTPALWEGKLFFGVQGPTPYGATGHSLRVVDGQELVQTLSVPTPGFVQTEPLLSTARLASGRISLYMTYNQLPGGLFMVTLATGDGGLALDSSRTGTLFTPPQGMQNYGISTLAGDASGNLYYKNDACYLMAVKAGYMLESRPSAGGALEGIQAVPTGGSFTFHMTPSPGYKRVDTLVDGASKGALASYTFSGVTGPHWIKPVFAPVTTPGFLTAVSAGYDRVKLTWASAPGFSGWLIFRATSATGTYSHIATLAPGTLSYTNTGLTTGRTYYYKIRGYYKSPTGLITYSNFSTTYKAAIPRLATPAIATTAGTDRIKVSWKAIPGAHGYKIYRKTTSTGTLYLMKTVTSGTATSWTQYGLTTGKTYYYAIRAYRVVSGVNKYSAWSNVSARKPY